MSGIEYLLDLALKFCRKIFGIAKIAEIYSRRFRQRQAPQIESRLIGKDKATLPVKNVSKITDG